MQYRVISDQMELPRGTHFIVIKMEVDNRAVYNHALALFEVNGRPIIGRLYLDHEGQDFILIPGRRLIITGEVEIEAVGLVIPTNFEFAPTHNLTEAEYERSWEVIRRWQPVAEFPSYL